MLGAIAGDIFCASYEFDPEPHDNVDLFERHRFFTDDTVLTIATADALLTDGDYTRAYREWGRRYPNCSWGARFHDWLFGDDPRPYNSFGNGSAMRVSPIGWAFGTLEETLAEARRSAAVTHNHPEGIKGAQATAAAIFLARTGATKADIRREITDRFGYDLNRTVAEIRPGYSFDVTCQGSVPEALIAFLDADDFEHTLRLVISLGGDADTQGAIACAVAEAFWGGIPTDVRSEVDRLLPDDMKKVIEDFEHSVESRTMPDDLLKETTEETAHRSQFEKEESVKEFLERVGSADKEGPRTMFGATPDDVQIWVDEHQIRCEPERTATIRNIDFNWCTLEGTCTVDFDGVPCANKLSLRYDITPTIGFSFPYIHSPLGAPATYSAYLLSPEASKALRRAIDSVFPKIRGFGRQKEGWTIHSLNSTNRDRWPPKEILDKVKERLADPNLEVTVQLDDI